MIKINDIRNGIVDAIAKAFPDAVISDDPYSHVEGGAFIVKVVDMSPEAFSKVHARRSYGFDVVFFAPMTMAMHEIDAKGQELVEAFMYPLDFAGRHVYPRNVVTQKVDKDFHVMFDVEFFDSIAQFEEYELMGDLEFHLVLG